jgi:hypothetical protein
MVDSDGGLVWPRYIVEFPWKHGLSCDSTNDLWRYSEYSILYILIYVRDQLMQQDAHIKYYVTVIRC